MNGPRQMNGRTQSQGPIVKIFKGLATGVGFVSESIQHHKEKKRAHDQQEEQQETSERAGSGTTTREYDEADWQLDEAQQELSRETSQTPSTPDSPEQIPGLADSLIRNHPPTAHLKPPSSAARLELPVVVTQRRPKARDRGFVKAYAPILEDVGIDLASFLDFIDKLNKAVEPSPWIQAINLASFATQHVPLAISMAVSVALKIVADSASEVHSRTKTNLFLDKVNEEYFEPRGSIALLMTWKPHDPSAVATVNFDLETTITKASSGSNQGTFTKIQSRMKSSSAATSFEFPETAPLIFPALDKLASSTSDDPVIETKKQNIVKRGGSFVGDYLDRRAVAQWAGENPGSKLANAAPKPEFRSRYADPNHPASSGDPLAFITAGKISSGIRAQDACRGGATRRGGFNRGSSTDSRSAPTRGRGGFDRGSIMDSRYSAMRGRGFNRGVWDRRAVLDLRWSGNSDPHAPHGVLNPTTTYAPDGEQDQSVSSRKGGRVGGSGIGPLSLIGGVKKLLQKDVLYLMIVSLPTEEEMAQAEAELQ